MKKSKVSVVEKHLIVRFLIVLAIQLIALFAFVRLLDTSHLDANDIKSAQIVVQDTKHIKITRESWLVIDSSDADRYIFPARPTMSEYSTAQLNDLISKGDVLTVKYIEGLSLLGNCRFIVDARTEKDVYRSLEEYSRGKEGTDVVIVVSFVILDLIFLSFVALSAWLDRKTIKVFLKRLRTQA